MVVTLILIAIGVLLFLIISYNIVQQYKQKQEAASKMTIAKQKAIIDETEEIMLNASRVPFSKALLTLLYKRMITALQAIKSVDNNYSGLNQRLRNVTAQMEQVDSNYQAMTQVAFRSPDSDKEAIQILKVLKKIRAVVRSEHSKGKIATNIYVNEDRVLELMQLKVNVENALKRAKEAFAHRQYGTARQILNKGITAISSVTDKDETLILKLEEMKQMNIQMAEEIKSAGDTQTQKQAEDEIDELDVLFAPKKKW